MARRRLGVGLPLRLRLRLGRAPLVSAVAAIGKPDEHVASRVAKYDVAGRGKLLREVTEGACPIRALGKSGVELQQRALQESELRSHFAIDQHLQCAAHERNRLL